MCAQGGNVNIPGESLQSFKIWSHGSNMFKSWMKTVSTCYHHVIITLSVGVSWAKSGFEMF